VAQASAWRRITTTETGGQYFEATPDTYSMALQEILLQLHSRYELGFKPERLDGKRHVLRVTLADAVKVQHRGIRLRYRTAYVLGGNAIKIDSRCDELRKQGAEVVEGDLNIPHYGLNRGCVQSRNDVESNEAQEHANSGLAL